MDRHQILVFVVSVVQCFSVAALESYGNTAK